MRHPFAVASEQPCESERGPERDDRRLVPAVMVVRHDLDEAALQFIENRRRKQERRAVAALRFGDGQRGGNASPDGSRRRQYVAHVEGAHPPEWRSHQFQQVVTRIPKMRDAGAALTPEPKLDAQRPFDSPPSDTQMLTRALTADCGRREIR